MRIQYVSNLHLDIRPSKFRKIITPSADILILAGDIGHPFRKTFELFLRWCSQKFEYVIFIPGNSDYHGSSLKAGRKKMKKVCHETDTIFLEKGEFKIPETDIVILGTTLWTYIPRDRSFDVLYTIDDYTCIKGFDLNINNYIHSVCRNWLITALKKYSQHKIIVVSHHAPVPKITSSPKHRHSTNLCAYSSDCRDILKHNINIWIFGHTNYNTTFKYENTIVTSNQCHTDGYQKNYTLEI